MKEVIVVESGAKTKTIRQFLRGNYDVIACGGHIIDLSDDDLGVDVENDFELKFKPIKYRGKSKVARVKEQLEDADRVYLAMDPDREGEAIAADIAEYCLPEDCEFERIEFNAIVYHAVVEALENPRPIHKDRVEAQRARRALDRLIGFIISSLAQFDPEGPGCPSVGRVQSPAVSLVVDREREIEAFEPRRYWKLNAQLILGDETLEAVFNDEWDDFSNVEAVVKTLDEQGEMIVTDYEEDPEYTFNPRPPYTTDTLQDEADRFFGYTPDYTLELAQELYQGVEIDGKSQALITYMRTDSTRLSPSALNLAKAAIEERFGSEELYKGRTWKPSGAEQDAHEAIRPTMPEEPELFPENLDEKLNEPLLNIYKLIYTRFLGSQMAPAIYLRRRIELKSGEYEAVSEGYEMKSPGFLEFYRTVFENYGLDEAHIPALKEGDELELERIWPEPEETFSPGRYREGALVRELKNRGIGRPSTYGTILSKIKRGRGGFGYVQKIRGKLRPTERGEALCEYLSQKYHQVISYEYTAKMEEKLEKIEKGEESYLNFIREEFSWLKQPYEYAMEKNWLSGNRPTPAQLKYLNTLAEEQDVEISEDILESKERVSRWINKLREAQELEITLGGIKKVDVGGVECYRFRLFFNQPLPDEEKEFLKTKKMKYKPGKPGLKPSYQFQRQNKEVVEKLWDEIKDRYSEENIQFPAEFILEK